MTIWEAILLGVIQGITEFLPVSSSGHLEIANALFGLKESDNLIFATALHGATVLSTIVVFYSEIIDIIRGIFRFEMNFQTKFMINIIISMIPIAIVGLLFKDSIETLFTGDLTLVGFMLLVTAALLMLAVLTPKGDKTITPLRAFIIGIMQSVAIIPGISRSGSTISTGLMLGVKTDDIARFSFLMVLIPILGINLLGLLSGDYSSNDNISSVCIFTGSLSAFITGTIACRFMINIVRRGKLIWFALYCLMMGVSTILYSLL